MSISVSGIKSAYDTLGTAAAATASAYATLIGLGARPTYPVDVVADSDYNNVTATIATWDASYATDSAAYNVAVAAQRAQEAVTEALMPLNQWVKLTSLANWGSATTQYIGYPCPPSMQSTANSCSLYGILTVDALPTRAFPLS